MHKSVHDPPINDRQARWIESMATFPYHYEWIKGSENTLADALSRYPSEEIGATGQLANCEPKHLKSITVVHSLLAGLWKGSDSSQLKMKNTSSW